MRCQRCEGLMVQENLLDLDDLGSGPWIQAWRCINCGAIVEDRIRLNRLADDSKPFGGRSPVSTGPERKHQHGSTVVREQKDPCLR